MWMRRGCDVSVLPNRRRNALDATSTGGGA
jgi:hypothetical protein